MSREVRRVPADWEHPKDGFGRHMPMFDESYEDARAEWLDGLALWLKNEHPDQSEHDSTKELDFWEWGGGPPDRDYYRPHWTDEERTHYQMYQTTSEGSPISPVMETPEELARWLADNNANAFAGDTASYESWLRVCNGGYAPSAVKDAGSTELVSGVEACSDEAAV